MKKSNEDKINKEIRKKRKTDSKSYTIFDNQLCSSCHVGSEVMKFNGTINTFFFQDKALFFPNRDN